MACLSISRISGRNSDEGYNSDLSLSPRENSREEFKIINREVKEFKEKYFVEKLLNNSANGVIYTGKFNFHTKNLDKKKLQKMEEQTNFDPSFGKIRQNV